MIDFEQLKIENQTYIEKIDERNDELGRLKNKTSYIVQTLTHVKQKLACKIQEQITLSSELKNVEIELRKLRDELPQKKRNVAFLKHRNTNLKEKGGMSGNEVLLRDYENKYVSLLSAISTYLQGRIGSI